MRAMDHGVVPYLGLDFQTHFLHLHLVTAMQRLDGDALKQQFDNDGYVLLRGLLNQHELTALENNFERFVREVVPTMPPENVFYDEKGRSETLKQIVRMHEFDHYFQELFLGENSKGWPNRCLATKLSARTCNISASHRA